ncbi:MAG: MFS transporter [Mycobacterium sp.]|uniref:MFS transporter n=1 Tax=Mycobacterium sp. TaxID=1785 RepID=UPI003CC688A1
MGNPGGVQVSHRARVLAWALWEFGATGLNAIVVTFVFSVYLTGTVGEGTPGGTSPASWLGRALSVAGLTIALLAPLIGVWVEAPRRRRLALTLLTGLAVTFTCLMSLIRDDPRYLLPGLVLLAATAACSDLASVPYNTMLKELSTPESAGRISGFGWAAGYTGSVCLLLVVYLGFISGKGPTRGLLHLTTHDGLNVRAAMLLAAAWLAVFAAPLLSTARKLPAVDEEPQPSGGLLGGYRKLWSELTVEWRRDRNLVFFLVASAVFRDGLAGLFAFGAVLGVNVYGISQAEVLIFGVSASVVAACGAALGGLFDDRIGSKPVIAGSLAAIIAVGLVLMTLSGARAFWICGLLLCLFIGPAQSSARTLLLRMSREGKEGVAFGLYTMSGRAVSFLAPWLFSVFVDAFHGTRFGMGGLDVVLSAGLLALLLVRVPRRVERREAPQSESLL